MRYKNGLGIHLGYILDTGYVVIPSTAFPQNVTCQYKLKAKRIDKTQNATSFSYFYYLYMHHSPTRQINALYELYEPC